MTRTIEEGAEKKPSGVKIVELILDTICNWSDDSALLDDIVVFASNGFVRRFVSLVKKFVSLRQEA